MPRPRWTKRAKLIWGTVGLAAVGLGTKVYPTHYPPLHPQSVHAQHAPKSVPLIKSEPIVRRARVRPNSLLLRAFTIQKKRLSDANRGEVISTWKNFAQQSKKLPPNILSESQLSSLASELEHAYGIPQSIYRAFARQESQRDANAIGGVLELGLTQIRPERLVEIQELGYRPQNPLDPRQNLILFSFSFHDFYQSARVRTDTEGNKIERRYLWEGKDIPFQRLPLTVQLQIVARLHNAGVNGTYRDATTNRLYDPYKILEGKKGEYAKGILRYYQEYAAE